ncbi:MAG: hypothetical protein KGL39_32705 [Patescibacteria group bacterium]|nr:hypothetical protein [Patescibacteria group bacterium]
MTMLHTRTWPYGTRKKVEVLAIDFVRGVRVLTCVELTSPGETPEGFILMGDDGDAAKEGDIGEIVFCEGQAGAYWKYEEPIPF